MRYTQPDTALVYHTRHTLGSRLYRSIATAQLVGAIEVVRLVTRSQFR
jgi:hypothetical protein